MFLYGALCLLLSNKLLAATDTTQLFPETLFYDGYAATVIQPVPETVIRLQNYLYACHISNNLSNIASKGELQVLLRAACDNYDRIGSVSIALLPKGIVYNGQNAISKMELARFITPFMNKNKMPNQVVYHFDSDAIPQLLTDKQLLSQYDVWMEVNIFGVPYDAQKKIVGCGGRNDTFFASVYFVNDKNVSVEKSDALFVPIAFKDSLNNYQGTDTIGKTVRTYRFHTARKTKHAKIFLISSNHGAGENGEEYVRRKHFVYLDGKLVFQYTPGGKSCEEYRVRNTQNNGIYEKKSKTLEEWASWNNWCPGSEIPIREIDLKKLSKGEHRLTVSVPDALFSGKEGYFPVSAYLLAK